MRDNLRLARTLLRSSTARDQPMNIFSRREFLQALAAAGASCAVPALRAQGPTRFADDPFRLGVASGYPRPDGAVLWTRLVPDLAQPNGGLAQPDLPISG